MSWETEIAALQARVQGLEQQASQFNTTAARMAASLDRIAQQAPQFAQGAAELPGAVRGATSAWDTAWKVALATVAIGGGTYAGLKYARSR